MATVFILQYRCTMTWSYVYHFRVQVVSFLQRTSTHKRVLIVSDQERPDARFHLLRRPQLHEQLLLQQLLTLELEQHVGRGVWYPWLPHWWRHLVEAREHAGVQPTEFSVWRSVWILWCCKTLVMYDNLFVDHLCMSAVSRRHLNAML